MPKPHYWWDDPDLREQVRVLVCEQYDRRAGYRLVQQHGYTGTLTTFYGRLGILDWVLPQGEAVRRKHAAGRGEPVPVAEPARGVHDAPALPGTRRLDSVQSSGIPQAPVRDFSSDKKVGTFNWRSIIPPMAEMQRQIRAASASQDHATVDFSRVTEPICVVGLSDLHMASWAADSETLVRVTDELLSTPHLYAILLGDELEMAIKMRSVAEMAGNALPPKMQFEMLRSWLEEIQHKVLASVWSNHQHEREEKAVGVSVSGQIFGERVIHHSGIGHLDAIVGAQTYTFALSHLFRGRSMYNPVHSQGRYIRHEGQDREIVMAGDSHVPGIGQWYEGGMLRTFINGGSAQIASSYAKRYFSLHTVPAWPCVVLDPAEHRVTPYWSVAAWLAATKGVAA